ncbi:MAG: hypothetical protein ACPLYD_11350, partial [Anaerolineae bacterium]
MAWLYLLLVILLFYTPIVGLGPLLLHMDWEIALSGLRLPVPFTGTIRLFFVSLVTWWLLWGITRWIEERTGFDIFYWLDRQLPFLRLRERWIYATRPPLSSQLAVRLAGLGVAISLVKAVGGLLLGVLLAVAVPQLIQSAIPSLIESLLVRFPETGWVDILAGWLSGPLMEWLAGAVMNGLQDALDSLLGFRLHASLLAISILVLVADSAYQQERQERYQLEIKRVQQERKLAQRHIKVLP